MSNITRAMSRHYICAKRKAFLPVQKQRVQTFKGFPAEENWLFHNKARSDTYQEDFFPLDLT